MKLIKLHDALVESDLTRKHTRRLTRWLKNGLGVPDAYGDLLRVIREQKPAAVLDVGAFHGETVVRFVDEGVGMIHAFEPTPASAEILRRRFAKVPGVKVQEMALSNQDGTMRFFFNNNPQTNSLLDNDEGNKKFLGASAMHQEASEVKTMTLDSWLAEHVPTGKVVIKADMQGAEGMLLDGGKKAFAERVIAFYTEVQISSMYVGQADFFALQRRLTTEFGFNLHQVYPCMCNDKGEATQTDALWLKRHAG